MLHEYEADKLTIDSGIDASQYQLLLVKKAVGEKRFHMANGFNHSKLKTRIKMIGRSDTRGWVRLAYILFIPLLFAVMCCCTQKSLNHGIVPLSEIYQHPIFEGGDANTFSRWVNQQLIYPKKCHDEKIQGRVTVQFTVNEFGKVCDVKVLKGVCEELDNEALRVIKKSPLWTPARMESGVAVPVSYTFPIMFMLREP
jgi:TonB family protein